MRRGPVILRNRRISVSRSPSSSMTVAARLSLALMAGRDAPHEGAARSRQPQFDGAPVARRHAPLDEPVAFKQTNDLGHVGPFDVQGVGEHALTYAGIVGDGDKNADPAGADVTRKSKAAKNAS